MKIKQINELEKFLRKNSFTNESNDLLKILKYADTRELVKWETLLAEVKAPATKQIFGTVLDGIIDNAGNLARVSFELSSLGFNGTLSQEASLALSSLIASNSKIEASSPIDGFEKKSQLMKTIKNLGAGAVKLIPLMTFVISLKNLLYGTREAIYLAGYEQSLGIEWYEVFQPNALSELIDKSRNDCDKLIIITKMIKSMKVFIDEMVSMPLNFADGIKDFIFFFMDWTGYAIIPDIAISLFIGFYVDKKIDTYGKESYNVLLEKIGNIATEHIREESISIVPANKEIATNYKPMTSEEIAAEFGRLNSKTPQPMTSEEIAAEFARLQDINLNN
jgi:hypothetical protein